MNFVFISPNFPETYWNFCDRLKARGVNVLGVGDASYDSLDGRLKACLTEYYRVDSLEDYAQAYRAVAYFSWRYGKIDWLESNNEYWLETDARLRTDFNITTGPRLKDIDKFKSKATQKIYYAKGGVPTARQSKVTTPEAAKAFLEEVGYPVIVKPEVGVGAEATYKVCSDAELSAFFATKPSVPYVMEEFVTGDIYSYDAIVDSHGEPLFETGNVTTISLMDVVNELGNSCFYIRNKLPEDMRERGRAALKAFGVKSRFVHFEFFRLNRDQHIGKKGEVVALEVNMRPSGGISPSMMNYANGTDVYKIWADMIAFDSTQKGCSNSQYCVFAGRRDHRRYVLSRDEVLRIYGYCIREAERVDPALATDMGDYMFLACFDTEEELSAFIRAVFEEV